MGLDQTLGLYKRTKGSYVDKDGNNHEYDTIIELDEIVAWRKRWDIQDWLAEQLGNVIENCQYYEISFDILKDLMYTFKGNDLTYDSKDNEDDMGWIKTLKEYVEDIEKAELEEKYLLLYQGWW